MSLSNKHLSLLTYFLVVLSTGFRCSTLHAQVPNEPTQEVAVVIDPSHEVDKVEGVDTQVHKDEDLVLYKQLKLCIQNPEHELSRPSIIKKYIFLDYANSILLICGGIIGALIFLIGAIAFVGICGAGVAAGGVAAAVVCFIVLLPFGRLVVFVVNVIGVICFFMMQDNIDESVAVPFMIVCAFIGFVEGVLLSFKHVRDLIYKLTVADNTHLIHGRIYKTFSIPRGIPIKKIVVRCKDGGSIDGVEWFSVSDDGKIREVLADDPQENEDDSGYYVYNYKDAGCEEEQTITYCSGYREHADVTIECFVAKDQLPKEGQDSADEKNGSEEPSDQAQAMDSPKS